MAIIRTARLAMRELDHRDAGFIFELLNDADFIRYIGDRGVGTPDDARSYIETRLAPPYRQRGFGLWRVEDTATATPVGICGLLQRDYLDAPDLGFAYLPGWRRRGIGLEAGRAVLDYAAGRLRIPRVLAIVSPCNQASIGLLDKLGFHRVRRLDTDTAGDSVDLYQCGLVQDQS